MFLRFLSDKTSKGEIMSAIHFYLTFNPYLNHEYEQDYTQAHEFYDFLKILISKDTSSSAYWGKIIGKDRKSNINFEQFQDVLAKNTENNLSTHLYITDFKNIWVGKVKSISHQLAKGAETLSFYEGKKVEIWFEISDFMLLEHDPQETANKLGDLYIENDYSEKVIHGLSPFTTSIRYPCFIQDIAEEQYFDELNAQESSHLILKSNPAITMSNANRVLKGLHTYVFPEEMYAKIPHAAKLEIEAAEVDMLEQRHHNTQKIAFSYLKALEIVLNDLIVNHIKRSGLGEHFFVDATSAPPKLYLNPTKDFFISLKQFNRHFSMGHLLSFVDRASNQNHMGFKKAFSDQKQFIRFLLKDASSTIKDNFFVEIRNVLAHGENEKVSFRDAMAVRNIILGGAGTSGLIPSLYFHFYKEKFQEIYQVVDFNKPKKEQSKRTLKLVG